MKKYVKIEGIYCNSCKRRIKNVLLKNKNITDVKIFNEVATITYENNLSNKEIVKRINDIDYYTKEEYISDQNIFNKRIKLIEFITITLTFLLINLLIYKLFGYNIFNIIPNIDSNITYTMLFVTGLLTSIHCISMCGAINLVAIYSNNKDIKKPLLYNLGRLISYTLIGGIVGLIGSALSINNTISGIIILLASGIMFIMSLKLLGIIDLKDFCFIKKKIKINNSFIIGLINGLMPCGPLQAMQVYALTTTSFIKGALSMFIFCLGTIPLMLVIGIIFNLVKGKIKTIINKIAAVLIMLLSLIMVNRGLLSLNIDIFKNANDESYEKTSIKDNIQEIEFDLDYNNYKDIIVQKSIPVRIIINVDKKHLTGCNNEIIISEFNIKKKLKEGKNIIGFTPSKIGTFTYTCWMNMIKNNIKVIDNKSYFKKEEKKEKVPVRLKEITGKIYKAQLDNNGDIIIRKNKITEEVSYYSYKYEGVVISMLAVKDKNNITHIVINTCTSCGGSPYAYYVQVGDKIQCQNCGYLFSIEELDNLKEDDCNPIKIETIEEKDDIITISHKEIEQYKEKFENWKGPKK